MPDSLTRHDAIFAYAGEIECADPTSRNRDSAGIRSGISAYAGRLPAAVSDRGKVVMRTKTTGPGAP